jgi:integrase
MTGGKSEAIWARDRLLLSLTMSNPLRARNLKELTYKPDNTGHLRKTPVGGWRIFIPKEDFKNVNGAAKTKDYDQAVNESIWPHIDRYLRDYRNVLGGSRPDLVFVSKKTPGREWRALNRRYEKLTRLYMAGCPGTGPHSIRHIVATTMIKNSGDIAGAAAVLHDEEETVRQHYKHLLPNDADRWRDNSLGATLQKLNTRSRLQLHPRGRAGQQAPVAIIP